jgi:hypothetical protein
MARDHVGYSPSTTSFNLKFPILPTAKIIDLAPLPFVIALSSSHFRYTAYVLSASPESPATLIPFDAVPVQSLHI